MTVDLLLAVLYPQSTSRIDPRPYAVAHAVRFDDHRLCTAQSLWNTENGLQGIALGAPSGRAVRRLVGCACVEVQDLMDCLNRDTGTVVSYSDVDQASAGRHLYVHLRRNTSRLSSVQGIVEQLFQDHGGEFIARLTGLGLELAGVEVLSGPQ